MKKPIKHHSFGQGWVSLRYEALEDSVAHDEDMTLASSGGHMQKVLAQEAAHTSATRAVLLESKMVRLYCYH
jgi:hypothetical protein